MSPAPSAARARRGAALIALLALALFGPQAPLLGFYLDDWALLGPLLRSPGQSLRALTAAFNPENFWYLRPMDILYHPGLYWWAGMTAWKYQLVFVALEALTAALLFLALLEATGDEFLALATAALYAIFPSHAATHQWFAAVFDPAMALYAVSLWLYAKRLAGGGRSWLISALAVFLAGALTYEAVVPLGLLWPALDFLRERRGGAGRSIALRSAALRSWPIAGAMLAVLVYQVAVHALLPRVLSRGISVDPLFALKVLGRGVECSSTGLVHLLWKSAGTFPTFWGWPESAALAAAAAAAALLVRFAAAPARSQEAGADLGEWSILAGLLFAAAYAPYAVSADRYLPHIFDVQNRINAPGSLPAAMLAAAGLARLRRAGRPWAPVLALALLTSVALCVSGRAEWRASWRLQQRILADVGQHADSFPQGPVILVLKAPEKLGNAPVFDQDWAFDAALKTTFKDGRFSGRLWREDLTCAAGGPPCYVDDVERGTFTRL